MSLPSVSNYTQQQSSLCPTFVLFYAPYLVPLISSFSNGRHAVGDGAFTSDNTPSVLAVCHMQGTDDMYYYSTTFSGGPGVRPLIVAASIVTYSPTVAFLTSLTRNALPTEGRQTV